MKKYSNESGRSMIEMLGVIGIIGVITVGGISSMGYVDSYFRTSSTLMEVEQMARDINDMYSWSSSFPDTLNIDELISEDVIDTKQNRWGGEISVSSFGDGFSIKYTMVRQGACERIVEQAPTLKEVHLVSPTSTADCTDDITIEFESN